MTLMSDIQQTALAIRKAHPERSIELIAEWMVDIYAPANEHSRYVSRNWVRATTRNTLRRDYNEL
jgi:hypothetical protein